MDAMRKTIDMAVEMVGKNHGYAFILNTDAKAFPWLNPDMGEDVTEEVKAMLK